MMKLPVFVLLGLLAGAPPIKAQTAVKLTSVTPTDASATLTSISCPSSNAASGCLPIQLGGWTSVAAQISGITIFGTTAVFEVTTDNIHWRLQNMRASNGSTVITTTTSDGQYYNDGPIVGRAFRVRLTAIFGSTPFVSIRTTGGTSGAAGSGGGGGGGGAVTVADGADITQGTTGDAPAADTDGTVNAHVRFTAAALNDVWNNTGHYFNVVFGNSSLAVTQSGLWPIRLQDGAGNAVTSTVAGAVRPLDILVHDSSGNIINSFGGAGGTSQNDNTAFAYGSGPLTPIGCVYNSSITNITSGRTGGPACTVARKLHVALYDALDNPLTTLSTGSQRPLTVAIVDGSGTQITAFSGSGGTASNFGSAAPSAGTAAGASDGTNMQLPRVFDTDTGGGTQYVSGAVLRASASGGSVEAGTSTNPLRVDVTGSTTQPVSIASGTVTTVSAVTAITNALPAGSNVIGHVIADTGSTTAVTGTVTTTPGGNVASGATDSGNPIKVGGKYNSSPITLTNGQRGDVQLDASGFVKVNVAAGSAANAAAGATASAVPASADYQGVNVSGTLRGQTGVNPTGSTYAADVNVASIAGTTAFQNTQATQDAALTVATTTGNMVFCRASTAAPSAVSADNDAVMFWCNRNGTLSVHITDVNTPKLLNSLSTSVQTVVGAAAILDGYYCANPNAAVAYVQIFDISGAVTLGTSVPVLSLAIPPNDGAANLAHMALNFSNAIKVAATTTPLGVTAPSSPLNCNAWYR